MDVKYSVRNKEELEFLEKAYLKLMKYYDVESVEGLEMEKDFSTIKIWPRGINSQISKIEKKDLGIVVEEGEDFCERCGLLFNEEKTKFAYNIDIKGTHYYIKLKHKFNGD